MRFHQIWIDLTDLTRFQPRENQVMGSLAWQLKITPDGRLRESKHVVSDRHSKSKIYTRFGKETR